jgi:hypothetical protein
MITIRQQQEPADGGVRGPRMSRPALRAAAVLGLAVLTAACAQRPGANDAGSPGASEAPRPPGEGLVLEVAHTGGFVMPQMLAGRLPLAAVYADGRVISHGPVPAIYPGPALPNLQVQQMDVERLPDLVRQARDAGIGGDPDLGRPTIADATSTRFTLVTDEGTDVLEVYALQEALAPGGQPLPGLSAEEQAAREPLRELITSLTRPEAASTAYEPGTVAAIATAWTPVDDGLPAPEPVAWPGPPLPGDALDERLGVHCVTADGAQAQAVLEAARSANAATPWTSEDGTRWSLVLRPLLPHESGCADLVG